MLLDGFECLALQHNGFGTMANSPDYPLLLPLMKRTETISLDTDWLWRVLLYRAALGLTAAARAVGDGLSSATGAGLSRLHGLAMRHLSTGDGKDKAGVFARAWPIGSTALWIAVLLTGYVLVYYF